MATTVEQLKQAQAQNRELLKEIKTLTTTVQTAIIPLWLSDEIQ
ncbi:hypothetical protein [Loigolactobacillus coryniformis]|nr:hypothetical protein [Loigolactobacillus coryniformis]